MKDVKGHGSNPRGAAAGMHSPANVLGENDSTYHGNAPAGRSDAAAAAAELVGERRIDPFLAGKVLDATVSRGQDYHALHSSQTSQLADYARQFGYRKSASSPGSTARAFHGYLHKQVNRKG